MLTFNVVEKNENTFLVVDSTGAICGVYSSREYAEKAIPSLKFNISNGSMPERWLRLRPAHALVTSKQNTRQPANRFKKNQ